MNCPSGAAERRELVLINKTLFRIISPENLGMSPSFHQFWGIFQAMSGFVSGFFLPCRPDTFGSWVSGHGCAWKNRGRSARFKDGSFYRLDHLYPEEMGFGWWEIAGKIHKNCPNVHLHDLKSPWEIYGNIPYGSIWPIPYPIRISWKSSLNAMNLGKFDHDLTVLPHWNHG